MKISISRQGVQSGRDGRTEKPSWLQRDGLGSRQYPVPGGGGGGDLLEPSRRCQHVVLFHYILLHERTTCQHTPVRHTFASSAKTS